jgi:hypothetical protein
VFLQFVTLFQGNAMEHHGGYFILQKMMDYSIEEIDRQQCEHNWPISSSWLAPPIGYNQHQQQ